MYDTARFRYRITDGGVALGVKLIETRLIQETAFGVTVAQVEAAGRGPVLMGAHGALGDTLPRTPRNLLGGHATHPLVTSCNDPQAPRQPLDRR